MITYRVILIRKTLLFFKHLLTVSLYLRTINNIIFVIENVFFRFFIYKEQKEYTGFNNMHVNKPFRRHTF